MEEVKNGQAVSDGTEKMEHCAEELKELLDFPRVCGRILFQLVSRKKHEKTLESAPHRILGDMAVMYHISLGHSRPFHVSVTVTRDLMECWGTEEADLYRLAEANTAREYPAQLMCMGAELLEAGIEMEMISPMYILTNQDGWCGASAILYPGMLERAAGKIGSDLVILPSSRHEMILLPFQEMKDLEMYRSMVQHVNQSAVPPEDVLSEEVFCYMRREGKVRVAEKGDVVCQ